MKEIANAMYDETDICPKCGNRLIPVLYYSASKGNTTVNRSYPDSFHKVKTTTVAYHNIQPCYAGWCEVCDRKRFEENQKKLAGKPRPRLVLPIIGGVLLAAGILILILFGSYGAIPGIGFLAALIGFLFICTLPFAIDKRKKYDKLQQEGWSYTYPSKESLSGTAAWGMNKIKLGNIEYLSMSEIERMQQQKGMN